jgi:hypothetical protein
VQYGSEIAKLALATQQILEVHHFVRWGRILRVAQHSVGFGGCVREERGAGGEV